MSRSAWKRLWYPALGIAAFEVVGSFGAAGNQPERRALDAVAVVLVLAGPAALALFRQRPMVAVAASMGSASLYVGRGHPYGPVFLAVVVSLFLAVQEGRHRSTWAMAAGGYGVFVFASYVDPRSDDVGWVHWSLVAGWLVVVLAVSEVVRVRRQHATDSRERRAGEHRLALAQELHDVLAHDISLINVQASVALHLLDDQPDRARPALAAIKDASHDALGQLRAALDILRRGEEAAPRTPAPRLDDLDDLVDGVRASGLDVQVEQSGQPSPMPSAVELAVYRIVQEALTNVTRHARANTATVRLRFGDDVFVEVVDDGVGGPAGAGNGIAGMRERAEALGGTVDAGPRAGGGFGVTARLPVRS